MKGKERNGFVLWVSLRVIIIWVRFVCVEVHVYIYYVSSLVTLGRPDIIEKFYGLS